MNFNISLGEDIQTTASHKDNTAPTTNANGKYTELCKAYVRPNNTRKNSQRKCHLTSYHIQEEG